MQHVKWAVLEAPGLASAAYSKGHHWLGWRLSQHSRGLANLLDFLPEAGDATKLGRHRLFSPLNNQVAR